MSRRVGELASQRVGESASQRVGELDVVVLGGAAVLPDLYAQGVRLVLVISDCSDFGTHYRHRHRHIAALAQQAAELVVFVGSKSGFTAKQALRLGMPPEAVRSFPTLASAAEFLKQELGPGDLALLRGRSSDHLARLYFAQLGQIECWRMPCG